MPHDHTGYKDEPDIAGFNALRQIRDLSNPLSIAISGSTPKDSYLVYNFSTLRTMEEQQPVALRGLTEVFNAHIQNIVEHTPSPPGEEKNWTLEHIASLVAGAYEGAKEDSDYAASAAALPMVNFAFIDTDRSHEAYSQITGIEAAGRWNVTEQEESKLQRFIFLHESAHMALKLDEPGADFVAAITLLQESPQSRPILQMFSGMRAIASLSTDLDIYGMECHDAIQYALSLPQAQVERMSVNEMLSIGHLFDDMSTTHNAMEKSPEQTVQDAFLGRALFSPTEEEAASKQSGLQHAQQAIREIIDEMPAGSKEKEIAESISNSLHDPNLIRVLPDSITQVPGHDGATDPDPAMRSHLAM